LLLCVASLAAVSRDTEHAELQRTTTGIKPPIAGKRKLTIAGHGKFATIDLMIGSTIAHAGGGSLSQLKSGLMSAPRLPQLWETNRDSISDNRTLSGQLSELSIFQWQHL
jgi:hypothetical protein